MTASSKSSNVSPVTKKVRAIAGGETAAASSASERMDTILRSLEEDIVAGKMLPGQHLDERALAARFGVSRTPIREALFKLSSLGIVELRRSQGAFVASISSARLVGMLDVMSELKVLAARQAARRMSVEERENLQRFKDVMTDHVQKGEIMRYFATATELHDVICEGTHNSYLIETIRNIQICLCAYRRHLAQTLHLPMQTSLQENCSIIDAIVRADSAEAERWMRQQTELRREEFADLITMISESMERANQSQSA